MPDYSRRERDRIHSPSYRANEIMFYYSLFRVYYNFQKHLHVEGVSVPEP